MESGFISQAGCTLIYGLDRYMYVPPDRVLVVFEGLEP